MRRARLPALLVIALIFGVACQSALGFWSGGGETGAGAAGAATVEQLAGPTAIEEGPGTVTVSWEAGTLSNGVPVDGYVVERYDEATEAVATIGPGCAGTITALTCTETEVPEGEWQYTVTPVFGANWRGPESAKSGGIDTVDLAREPAAAARTVFGDAVAAPAEGTGVVPESPAAGDEATPPSFAPTETGVGVSSPAEPAAETQTAPTNSLSLAEPIGAYLSSDTLYFDPDAAGSFVLGDELAGGAGPASVGYPVLDASSWTHAAETVTTPTGGPYDSSVFSWTPDPESPQPYPVTGEDSLGAVTATVLTFVSDPSPPSGGGITYPAGTVRTLSVPITVSAGTDSLSGIDAEAGRVERDEATLDTTTGVCGPFPGSFDTTVTLVEGADTSVAGGHCYQYRYVASDNVGNLATYTSADVIEVDTTGP